MKIVTKVIIAILFIIVLTLLVFGLPVSVGSIKTISPEANIKAKELKEKSRLNEPVKMPVEEKR